MLKRLKNKVLAFSYGVQDGWQQPLTLDWSRNVEHLEVEGLDAQDTFDSGVNLGQFLRAGRKSESWQEGYRIPYIQKAGVALKD